MKPVNLKKHIKAQLEKWIHASPSLHKLLHMLQPDIWHFNRRSVSGATWIGIFSAFIPLPVQSPIAIWLSLLCRVNLPIAVAGTFISNPVTMAPILFANYKLGAWLTGVSSQVNQLPLSLETLWQDAGSILLPLVIGSLSTGFILATTAYVLVRLIWRGYVVYLWKKRQMRESMPSK
jgi:hypothetical protein